MKQTIGFYQFRQAFYDMDRQDNFPNGGLSVLWDYLEQLEEDTGEELELDVVALCCDYYQMSYEQVAIDYQLDIKPEEDEDQDDYIERLKGEVLEFLQDNTSLVGEVGDDEVIYACL